MESGAGYFGKWLIWLLSFCHDDEQHSVERNVCRFTLWK